MSGLLFSRKSKAILNNVALQKSIVLCFVFFFFSATDSFSQSLTAEQIYKKVTGAVVVIHAYNSNNELAKQGSGVVINDKGYIVTNYHVLEGCERLEVLHNKEIIPYVDIIGIDVEKDILILKIEEKKFPSIKIGDIQKITIGQRAYAIGSPLGFENTISEGIISGLRNFKTTGRNFIQISASISPGSSGGAVVNDKGELIGISTLTVSDGQNINFAIPIDDALAVKIGSYSKDESYKDFELFSKGLNASKKGNYQEAISFYTSYLRKYPNDANAYNNRGNIKYKLSFYREAIQDFSKAIEINPNLAEVYNNRGIAKNNLSDYRGAIQDCNKALELNPNLAEAYLSRGNAKGDLKDDRGAIQDYNRAIEININYAMAYNNRGTTKYSLSDYSGAIQDYNKAIEINPNYADAYVMRGNVKGAIKDYRGAIQDCNKAIEINPKYAIAYCNRGVSKFQLGDNAGACLDWSKAGELGDSKAYGLIKEYCK